MEKYYLNIWDDFNDEDTKGTFVQLESEEDLSNEETKLVLENFLPLFKKMEKGETKVEMYLYDTRVLFPHMDEEACSRTGFRHNSYWQIALKNIKHETIETFMEEPYTEGLNYNGIPVEIISES